MRLLRRASLRTNSKHVLCAGDEAGALEDFKKAAQLGSEFAKTQMIARNPYAALCNAMMTEMMAKVRRGECS